MTWKTTFCLMFQLSHATKQLELARADAVHQICRQSLLWTLAFFYVTFFKRNDYFTVKQQVSGVFTWPNRFLQVTARRGGCVVSPGPAGGCRSICFRWVLVGREWPRELLGGRTDHGNMRRTGRWVTRREARHPSLLSAPGHSKDRLPPSAAPVTEW